MCLVFFTDSCQLNFSRSLYFTEENYENNIVKDLLELKIVK